MVDTRGTVPYHSNPISHWPVPWRCKQWTVLMLPCERSWPPILWQILQERASRSSLRHHVSTRSPRPSPSVFPYCKWSKTGGGNGLGMRLVYPWSENETWDILKCALALPVSYTTRSVVATVNIDELCLCHTTPHDPNVLPLSVTSSRPFFTVWNPKKWVYLGRSCNIRLSLLIFQLQFHIFPTW